MAGTSKKSFVFSLARLANLCLSSGEAKLLEPQLQETLRYVDVLHTLDTRLTPPTNQVTGLENILRDDVVHQCLSVNEALANANKNRQGNYFCVPGILKDES